MMLKKIVVLIVLSVLLSASVFSACSREQIERKKEIVGNFITKAHDNGLDSDSIKRIISEGMNTGLDSQTISDFVDTRISAIEASRESSLVDSLRQEGLENYDFVNLEESVPISADSVNQKAESRIQALESGNMETLQDIVEEDTSLLASIADEYAESGTAGALGIEQLVNRLMNDGKSTIYIGNIDLTSANNLDKTDKLGDELKQSTLEYFREKLTERGYLTPDSRATVTMTQTRLMIEGVPKEVIQEISEQLTDEMPEILESKGPYNDGKLTSLEGFDTSVYGGIVEIDLSDMSNIESFAENYGIDTTEMSELISSDDPTQKKIAVEQAVDIALRQAAGRANDLEKEVSDQFRNMKRNNMFVNDIETGSQVGYIPPGQYGAEAGRNLPRIMHNLGELNLLHSKLSEALSRMDEPGFDADEFVSNDPQLDNFFVGEIELTFDNLVRAYNTKIEQTYELATHDLRYPDAVKEEYFGEAISQLRQRTGESVTITHVELDGANAFFSTYSADSSDSDYHRIFDVIQQKAAERGIDIEFMKKGDEIFVVHPVSDTEQNMGFFNEVSNEIDEMFKDKPFQETRKVEGVEGEGTKRIPVWLVDGNEFVGVVSGDKVVGVGGQSSVEYDLTDVQKKMVTLGATTAVGTTEVGGETISEIQSAAESDIERLSELVNQRKTIGKGVVETDAKMREQLIVDKYSKPLPSIKPRVALKVDDIVTEAKYKLSTC